METGPAVMLKMRESPEFASPEESASPEMIRSDVPGPVMESSEVIASSPWVRVRRPDRAGLKVMESAPAEALACVMASRKVKPALSLSERVSTVKVAAWLATGTTEAAAKERPARLWKDLMAQSRIQRKKESRRWRPGLCLWEGLLFLIAGK